MLNDDAGKRLHDRLTLGKPLKPEEHSLLKQWYNEQDKAEYQMLNSNLTEETEDILQERINTILIRIQSTSNNIQKMTKKNKLLRDGIINLQSRLSKKAMEQVV